MSTRETSSATDSRRWQPPAKEIVRISTRAASNLPKVKSGIGIMARDRKWKNPSQRKITQEKRQKL